MRTLIIRPLAACLVSAVLVSGCASSGAGRVALPDISREDSVARSVSGCQARLASPARPAGVELRPESIRVLSWNIKKGSLDRWRDDLLSLAAGQDLVLIQEAAPGPAFDSALRGFAHRFFGPGYRARGLQTGVLTSSLAAAEVQCHLVHHEPWLGTPKSTTVTRYGLAGTDETLVVVNVHAVNFAVGLAGYRAQVDALAAVLSAHDGPVILAGDLNTWRRARARVIEDMAASVGLEPVHFEHDLRTQVFGARLDHIYVRGLTAEAAVVREVLSSDHNPLLARFAL